MLWIRFSILLEMLSGILIAYEYLLPQACRVDSWLLKKLSYRNTQQGRTKALFFGLLTAIVFFLIILLLGTWGDLGISILVLNNH